MASGWDLVMLACEVVVGGVRGHLKNIQNFEFEEDGSDPGWLKLVIRLPVFVPKFPRLSNLQTGSRRTSRNTNSRDFSPRLSHELSARQVRVDTYRRALMVEPGADKTLGSGGSWAGVSRCGRRGAGKLLTADVAIPSSPGSC